MSKSTTNPITTASCSSFRIGRSTALLMLVTSLSRHCFFFTGSAICRVAGAERSLPLHRTQWVPTAFRQSHSRRAGINRNTHVDLCEELLDLGHAVELFLHLVADDVCELEEDDLDIRGRAGAGGGGGHGRMARVRKSGARQRRLSEGRRNHRQRACSWASLRIGMSMRRLMTLAMMTRTGVLMRCPEAAAAGQLSTS